jgi:hypothetical protein
VCVYVCVCGCVGVCLDHGRVRRRQCHYARKKQLGAGSLSLMLFPSDSDVRSLPLVLFLAAMCKLSFAYAFSLQRLN